MHDAIGSLMKIDMIWKVKVFFLFVRDIFVSLEKLCYSARNIHSAVCTYTNTHQRIQVIWDALIDEKALCSYLFFVQRRRWWWCTNRHSHRFIYRLCYLMTLVIINLHTIQLQTRLGWVIEMLTKMPMPGMWMHAKSIRRRPYNTAWTIRFHGGIVQAACTGQVVMKNCELFLW